MKVISLLIMLSLQHGIASFKHDWTLVEFQIFTGQIRQFGRFQCAYLFV